MKESKGEEYLIILASCLDGCCTSQYQKEASIKRINLVDKTRLKEEIYTILKDWDRKYDEEEAE